MCVRVCVCICVYIPRYSRASLIIRYRGYAGSNTISRKCNKLAVSRYRQVYTSKPFRMSLSSRGFVTVPLSKYSIILVGGDRDRPWIELISPLSNGAAGFRATAFKQLVQQRSKRFHSTAGFAQFHHFPASFRNPGQKLRSQLFLHRDYCYVIINFYSFTRFTFVFTTSTKNRRETSRR